MAAVIGQFQPVPAEYRVAVIAIHENRVLVKPDSGVALTTDFVLRFTNPQREEYSCGIAGTLFGFAASDTIATADLEWIRSTPNLSVGAALDTAQVSDRLIIGLPECLRPLAYSFSPAFKADSNRYEFRYYSSAREAEIERKLGRWDIYIVPETELEPDSAIVLGDYEIVEWHLLVAEKVDDLAATALNYCVKGVFGDGGSPAISTLIRSRDITSIFPRNVDYAGGLFVDLKGNQRINEMSVEYAAQLPNTVAKLMEAVSGCQRGELRVSSAGRGQSKLNFDLIGTGSGSGLVEFAQPVVTMNADSTVTVGVNIGDIPVLTAADGIGINWREGVAAFISGDIIDVRADSLLSRSLSERCRVIPLGRTRLVARLGIHARCLQLPGRPALLQQFYSKSR